MNKKPNLILQQCFMNTHFALLLFMPLTLKPPGWLNNNLETHRNQSNQFSSTAICSPVPLSCMCITSISSGVDDCCMWWKDFSQLSWLGYRSDIRAESCRWEHVSSATNQGCQVCHNHLTTTFGVCATAQKSILHMISSIFYIILPLSQKSDIKTH